MIAKFLVLFIVIFIFPFAVSLDQKIAADGDRFIIQMKPGADIDRFLALYPSLLRQQEGKVRFGKFQAIYGQFDRGLMRYL